MFFTRAAKVCCGAGAWRPRNRMIAQSAGIRFDEVECVMFRKFGRGSVER